ncbi:MAG TPA: NAD(P)/FAD-dependent oxidoreductase [Bryobacteraceae bacterium]|jgi:protoporphyrinogen oxidase|nr:NAD(P)/FAD-dependent oxidoreductase [Bryobacteraceae bacterium]
MSETALIIGAGPAGLTAAYEFLKRSSIQPILLESAASVGGICRTVEHHGNRIDIGGHRFFTKSDRVMDWWLKLMPPERGANGIESIAYRNRRREINLTGEGPDPNEDDRVMLLRRRKSRIYFARRFFDYPLRLNLSTLQRLGPRRTLRILLSYLRSALHRIEPETTLEEFFINRFGRELYITFFKSYTEKVWGAPCREISAEWGAQRIKGLSLRKTVRHLFHKTPETSLIEKFLYPKYGPGQLWEYVADEVRSSGGVILMGRTADRLLVDGNRILGVEALGPDGRREQFRADYMLSTMPVKHLMRALDCAVPAHLLEISDALQYRDFLIAGLLLDRKRLLCPLDDNWIYIQEPDVAAGRLQIFNNWSPWMVADRNTVWIGVEYFCSEGDGYWTMNDDHLARFSAGELERIGILGPGAILDSTIIRERKAYPAYFGAYSRFDELKEYLNRFANLYLVGRNGMHRYNNQDHSMLTAMTAVDNILAGKADKSNIWAVNTEMEYAEEDT